MIWLNKKIIYFETFPNGETKVPNLQVMALGEESEVILKYESDKDLMHLAFVKGYLDSYNVPARLVILYMPYSRMDRTENHSVFTLKHVSDYINYLNFASVHIVEPHSDVTPALINRSITSYPTQSLLDLAQKEQAYNPSKDYIFYPDAGAQKRYFHKGMPSLVGYKHRNFETGQIESFQIVGDKPTKPFKAFIIDDLCSYGGTFIASAKELKKLGATEIYLIVAHAEESIFKGNLFTSGLIDKVYTTDSILPFGFTHPKMEAVEIYADKEY